MLKKSLTNKSKQVRQNGGTIKKKSIRKSKKKSNKKSIRKSIKKSIRKSNRKSNRKSIKNMKGGGYIAKTIYEDGTTECYICGEVIYIGSYIYYTITTDNINTCFACQKCSQLNFIYIKLKKFIDILNQDWELFTYFKLSNFNLLVEFIPYYIEKYNSKLINYEITSGRNEVLINIGSSFNFEYVKSDRKLLFKKNTIQILSINIDLSNINEQTDFNEILKNICIEQYGNKSLIMRYIDYIILINRFTSSGASAALGAAASVGAGGGAGAGAGVSHDVSPITVPISIINNLQIKEEYIKSNIQEIYMFSKKHIYNIIKIMLLENEKIFEKVFKYSTYSIDAINNINLITFNTLLKELTGKTYYNDFYSYINKYSKNNLDKPCEYKKNYFSDQYLVKYKFINESIKQNYPDLSLRSRQMGLQIDLGAGAEAGERTGLGLPPGMSATGRSGLADTTFSPPAHGAPRVIGAWSSRGRAGSALGPDNTLGYTGATTLPLAPANFPGFTSLATATPGSIFTSSSHRPPADAAGPTHGADSTPPRGDSLSPPHDPAAFSSASDARGARTRFGSGSELDAPPSSTGAATAPSSPVVPQPGDIASGSTLLQVASGPSLRAVTQASSPGVSLRSSAAPVTTPATTPAASRPPATSSGPASGSAAAPRPTPGPAAVPPLGFIWGRSSSGVPVLNRVPAAAPAPTPVPGPNPAIRTQGGQSKGVDGSSVSSERQEQDI